MIDVNKLKDIVKLMVENDLTELDLQDDKETVTLRRGSPASTVINHQPVVYGGAPAMAAPVAYAQPGPAAPQQAGVPAAPAAGAPAPAAADAGLIAIESPMVGTFYAAPNPDSAPFVTPGAKISGESVVCLIEAMKVFNEIKAEKTGTVERVLVKSGEAVEFGQKLFLVRP
jgi:acetyl-CoA carboxylase biotin carboxyl carrier protein